jgi:hypothetical protein
LWGANAVNGVVNVITKRAEDTRGSLVSGGFGNEEEGLEAFATGKDAVPTATIEFMESTLAVANRWIRRQSRRRIPGIQAGGDRFDLNCRLRIRLLSKATSIRAG